MCSGFRNKWTFLAIMGPCPANLSLDRVNNNGHYSCGQCDECLREGWPLNCRWTTATVQASNRRKRSLLTLGGITKNAKQWADSIGISQKNIHRRKRLGWSDERILTEALQSSDLPKSAKLNPEVAQHIRLEFEHLGERHGAIAMLSRKYNVTHATISRVVKNAIWKNSLNQSNCTRHLPATE